MEDRFTNTNNDLSIIDDMTRFHGFYDNVYRDPFVGGHAFVFVTKPLLFIDPRKPNRKNHKEMMAYMNMARDPLFVQYLLTETLNNKDRTVIESLSYKTEYSQSSFLPIFTNQCKNFDSSDVTMEQIDAFDTKQGFRQTLPSHKSASEAAGTISINVTEDSNLDFTKMMKLWVNYISNITDGTFDANPDMIRDGVLDYVSTIYYFVLAPDGKTLKYWAKYTGCWPTSIPYGALKYSKGSGDVVELDLNFNFMVKEDMNPKILEEFNIASLKLFDSKNLISSLYERANIEGTYTSINQSPLLNRAAMLEYIPSSKPILDSDTRDPLVFYRKASSTGLMASDSTDSHFELVFDDNGYKSSLISNIMDEEYNDYYINDSATNFVKNQEGPEQWDRSAFWLDE